MKKKCKLSITYDEEDIDSLPELIGEDGIWLDMGEVTVQLPEEIAKYIESDGILGIA